MGVACGKPRAAFPTQRRLQESQAMYWTAPMVGSWIDLIGLHAYKQVFLENGVDGPTLLELRRDQFERCLGLNNPLHELSLRYALADLKMQMIDYTKWEWSHAGVLRWLALRGLEQLVPRFTHAAVHGGVLLSMRKTEFAARLFVGEQGESELVLESLWHAVERARKFGFAVDPQASYLDWGPAEIHDWLDSIHLAHLNDLFREHAVNGTLLAHLDQNALRRTMKLTEIQSIVVLKAIRKLAGLKAKRWSSSKENSFASSGSDRYSAKGATARPVRRSASADADASSRHSAYAVGGDAGFGDYVLGDRTNL